MQHPPFPISLVALACKQYIWSVRRKKKEQKIFDNSTEQYKLMTSAAEKLGRLKE